MNFFALPQASLRQGLLAKEDIGQRQCICEYKGKVMLWHQFEDNQGSRTRRKKPYPFGLYYNKLEGLELFIDGRTSGNETRYVRRACHPNSEVLKFVLTVHLISLCINVCEHREKQNVCM